LIKFDRNPDSNGFYTSPVTIAWSGDDGSGTGIESCVSPTTYSGPDSRDARSTSTCTDKAGNVGTGTVTFSYDANPPTSTTITPSPAIPNGGKTKLNSITFTLGGTDTVGVTSYLCSLDGSKFAICPDAVSYTGLADGSHTFAAEAVDAALHRATTEQFSWTIDTVPPVISVPADITVEATISSGASVTYTTTAQDNLDGTLTHMCTPPSGSTFPLSTTTVSCSAQDSAGNQASTSFKVTVRDTTPPDTRIQSIQTSGGGSSNTVTIALQGSDNVGATQFKCALDSPTFSPCSSTVVYSNVRSGGHIFAASAVDSSGNVDSSPAVQPFTISGSPK
jgi:hypothetical protein